MRNKPKLPSPTIAEIKKYQCEWRKQENYVLQEKALKKLFNNTYPKNTDIDDILIKASTLNDFYSTNIFSVFSVAKHILTLNIDERLNNDDYSLVDEIADITINGTKKRFYSFASKYCSHHNQKYPIFDRYVESVLKHFRDKEKFYLFDNEDLKNYPKYIEILNKFQAHYHLENFSKKELDRYLWQLGKKYFPKKY